MRKSENARMLSKNSLIDKNILEANIEVISQALKADVLASNVEMANSSYGKSFLFYLLFSDKNKATAILHREFSDSEIVYNKYYWFSKFVNAYTLTRGSNAGLEQQRFQILERANCEIDWDVIEAVDKGIEPRLDV